TYPAPIIKFWGPAGIQVNASFTGIQQQQIPLLLLANANRIGALSDQILGQLVIQPAARGSDDLNVLWIQTHFFLQLSEQRLLQPLTVPDSPLRELPGFLAYTLRPEDLPLPVADDDAYIRSETLRVY